METRKCVSCDKEISGQKMKYCSNACKQKHHWHRIKEQPNSYHSQTKRALKRKLELVELKGGGCSVCGYDKNYAALQFHHLNPNEKKFNLDSRTLGNNKMETLILESEKCILLCANCHFEEHNPEHSKEDLLKIINTINEL
jgi:hypothetical protein